ncbi:MAG: N-acetylmuramoyl-L-alanine amidase [Thermodesulfobacteriota bacterium]
MTKTLFAALAIVIVLCLPLCSSLAEPAWAASEQQAYQQAEACYAKLVNNPEKQKFRHNWQTCIDRYKAVYKANPKGHRAAGSLFMAALLTEEMYRVSLLPSDKQDAINLYQRTIQRFPKTPFAEKAGAQIEKLTSSAKGTGPTADPPKVIESSQAKPSPSADSPKAMQNVSPVEATSKKDHAGGGYARITDLRVWSNPHYTRIAVDLDREASFSSHLLQPDASSDKPKRLFIEIDRCKLGKHIQKFIPVNDDLLLDARAGQYTLESVRVVADIKSFETYKVFSLSNPFRIIMDIWGKESEPAERPEASAPQPPPPTPEPPVAAATAAKQKSPDQPSAVNSKKQVQQPAVANVQIAKLKPKDLARQLALGVRRIVLDPGHGGRDKGAPGVVPGVYEKDITLAIALKLQKKLKENLGCEVILTRTTDKYLSLEERTAIANTKNGDLFISIHTNSAPHPGAYGIETYFLNLATDDDAVMVAARENATSRKNISDLQDILTELMKNAKIAESSRLAAIVQENLVGHLSEKYTNIRGKGVKQAPFYVLLGAQMPSVLVETSFISNERECKRLASAEYQSHLSDAIAKGITRYVQSTSPAAYLEPTGPSAKKSSKS